LRVILIFFALTLLEISFLKLIGAALLIWIGVKLLLPQDEDEHANIKASDKLWEAVKTIIVADSVMSLDNVIAIAGAVENASGGHRMSLVVLGLLLSIPLIVWGSQLVIKLMERFPVVITIGGMLLGWIAGTMALGDPALAPYIDPADTIKYAAGVAGALLVLAVGKMAAWRKLKSGAVATDRA
jgi:YjbE family integral membrane protein